MNDETAAGLAIVALTLTLLIVFGATLTQDRTQIDLAAVSEMSAKCESNEGLDYIEHDYDVVCKNGAEFNYNRLK